MPFLKKIRSLFRSSQDIYVVGSLSDQKTRAALKSIGKNAQIIKTNAPSNGSEQPFGIDDILTCAKNRANFCISTIIQKGSLSKLFKQTVYGIGIQSGITYDNFNDKIKNDVHEGFQNDSWRQATFYDRTAIVIQDDEGNSVTVWSTKMKWPDNKYVKMSATGGEITDKHDDPLTIKDCFRETVASIMSRSKGDDGMKLCEEHSKDPNSSFDKPGRSREIVMQEAISIAIEELNKAKKEREKTGNTRPVDLTFQIEYESPEEKQNTAIRVLPSSPALTA